MELKKLILHKNWADNVYLEYCKSLTDNQLRKTIQGYDKSIRHLLEHIWEATWFWLDLIETKEFHYPPEYELMETKEIIKLIIEQNNKILEIISENNLKEEFTIQWDKTDKPTITTTENIIFNLVTHNAYHRGQIAIFLRLLGLESIKETDFNPYLYEMGQK